MVRIQKSIFLSVVFIFFLGLASAMPPVEFNVEFYGQTLMLSQSEEIDNALDVRTVNKVMLIRTIINRLQNTDYNVVISQIQQIGQKYQFSDWLTYRLVSAYVKQAYASASGVKREVLTGFLMIQLGYNVQMAYDQRLVHLFVATNDQLYDTPTIQIKGQSYVNLTSIDMGRNFKGGVYLITLPLTNGRKLLYFSDLSYPEQFFQTKTIPLNFVYNNKQYSFTVDVNSGIRPIMNDSPLVDEFAYFEAVPSGAFSKSIQLELGPIIDEMEVKEALSFLAYFTRSLFEYQDDISLYGKSKPLVAEEVFLYKYSDCEDRSALYFYMVKELLGLPMIVVAFEDHISIAVNFDSPVGVPIRYKGDDYYFCDPTGPVESDMIGQVPTGYENKAFKIIGNFPSK